MVDMITCKLCRRVAAESPTTGWCLDCHLNAGTYYHPKDEPLTPELQTAYIIKYMRSAANRIKKGATTDYCECHNVDKGNQAGSQCGSYWVHIYKGRRVCAGHFRWLQLGSCFRFVGEADLRVDRAEAYKLLAAAYEIAPDDGLRYILARAIDDARNPKSKSAGAEAQEPSEGA